MRAPVQKSDYKPLDAGTFLARCYSVVDLGTHDEEYQGVSKPKRKVRITWELPTEIKTFEKDGEQKELPQVIGKEYTLSMGSKANLRKHIESMIGTALSDDEANAFDLYDLIGMACLLSIAHKVSATGNTYSIISSLAPLMKKQECPKQVNPSVQYDLEDGLNDVYKALPNFMREKIDESHERAGKTDVAIDDETGEEIPF